MRMLCVNWEYLCPLTPLKGGSGDYGIGSRPSVRLSVCPSVRSHNYESIKRIIFKLPMESLGVASLMHVQF